MLGVRYHRAHEIVGNRGLALEIMGGERVAPDPNYVVLVLQKTVPCDDGQNRLSVLLALISYSTTSM
jgi:hypothetical protein